jgi:TetR/AcrR family transcriptional regulator, lmrAB and yxaGH operons repressor
MSKPSSGARERILSATLVLLRSGGLTAAGLNDVVALASAPKGSIYHYFPAGKNQIVSEVIVSYRAFVADQISAALGGNASLKRRVNALFDSVDARMAATDYSQSCAVGAVTLDLAATDAPLRALCADALAHWATVAASHLVELPKPRRAAAGRVLVHLLEGAQLNARAAGSGAPLKDASAAFFSYACAQKGIAT